MLNIILSKKFAGFSLIELLVVITIMGILLMISVPMYNQYIIKAKMVDFLVLADPHKIKLLDQIINHSHLDPINGSYVIVDPSKLVSKLEHLINHQNKQYLIRMTANMLNLGIKDVDNQPLIVEFIAKEDDSSGLITWDCHYNKGYNNIMPKSCKEIA